MASHSFDPLDRPLSGNCRNRGKKTDLAYGEIRKMLLERRCAERIVISENSLAAELKMSRTPVREALQRLQMEGFIEIHPNRGILISEVSVVEVNETFALRMAIEEFVVRNICPLMTEDRLADMDAILALQKNAVEENDESEYLLHDRSFHEFFLRLYSNSLIYNTLQNVLERFMTIGVNVLRVPGALQKSFREHCSIAEAVRGGDGAGAASAMHRHMLTGRSNILSMQGGMDMIV